MNQMQLSPREQTLIVAGIQALADHVRNNSKLLKEVSMTELTVLWHKLQGRSYEELRAIEAALTANSELQSIMQNVRSETKH